tara:strand:- start:8555 stop:8776 length:222 start_codon:yes stop_codon:yes gene_type:complete
MKLYLVEDINHEQTTWFESKREAKAFFKSQDEGHLTFKEFDFPVTKEGIMSAIYHSSNSAGNTLEVVKKNDFN